MTSLYRGEPREGLRRFTEILAAHPDRNWARHYRALMRYETGDLGAIEELRAALGIWEKAGNLEGLIKGRARLSQWLAHQDRLEEAELELDFAEPAARASGRREWELNVLMERAGLDRRRGDFGRALRRLQTIEHALRDHPEADSGYNLNAEIGLTLATLGREDLALRRYRDAAAACRVRGWVREEERSSRLAMLAGWSLYESGRMDAGELRELAETTLALGRRTHKSLAWPHLVLAALSDGEDALGHYRKAAAEIERLVGRLGWDRLDAATVAIVGAGLIRLGGSRIEQGYALIEKARARAAWTGLPGDRVAVLSALARSRRRMGPRTRAVEDSLDLLDAIERVRDLQRDDQVRALVLGRFATEYRSFVGWLLGPSGGAPNEADIDLAFETAERLRARTLLESFDAGGLTRSLAVSGPSATARSRALEGIARIQRRLVEQKLSEAERAELLDRLERLEVEEREIRAALIAEDETFAELRPAAFPTTLEVRSALMEDEALLLYHVGVGPSEGGSWLFALTRGGVAVHSLPDLGTIGAEISVWVGLLRAEERVGAAGARRFGEILLGQAIRSLPVGVRRLTIAPDGPLWRLPFEALSDPVTGEPIAARYETALVPSATLLVRLREHRRADPAPRPCLSFADPQLQRVDEVALGDERAWALAEAARLGRLPHARREAEEMAASLGRGSVALLGRDASEAALKTTSPREFALIHFATHALVDEGNPDRSAVLLSPGPGLEDGLLQAREIVHLDLEGACVLLSACRTASGIVFAGEGPQSLAHAFFRAGARAVVGSQWALRDDEARRAVAILARHLARGHDLARSVAEARRVLIRQGAPPATWSGLVLLGDGTATAVAAGEPPLVTTTVRWRSWVRAVLASLIVILSAHLIRRARGRVPRPK